MAPWVDTRARFGQGAQVGARPKAAPEYIGATNRAARRVARLAELDLLLAGLKDRRGICERKLAETDGSVEDIDRALTKLPDTRAVEGAITAVATATARLADAEADVRKAATQLDKATGELTAQQRKLRRIAGERAMPATPGEVDAVAEAVVAAAQAADKLVAGRRELGRLGKDLASRRNRVAALEQDYRDEAGALAELEMKFEAEQAALQEAKASVDKGFPEIEAEIRKIDEELVVKRREALSHDSVASEEHDKQVGAARDLKNHRSTLRTAFNGLRESADEFEPYVHPDLHALLGVSIASPWPPSTRWATAEAYVEQITSRLVAQDEEIDAAEVIRTTLPADAVTLLDTYREAVRGSRALSFFFNLSAVSGAQRWSGRV